MHQANILVVAALLLAAAVSPGDAVPLLAVHTKATSACAWQVDDSWKPSWPEGVGQFSAVAVTKDADTGEAMVNIAQRSPKYPAPVLVYWRNGTMKTSWGTGPNGISTGAQYGVHGMTADTEGSIWVTDVGDHTIKQYSARTFEHVTTIGVPNSAGTSTSPLRFGNVADISFGSDSMFVSDGDGGVNDRVIGFSANPTNLTKPMFISGRNGSAHGEFSSPHSISYFNENALLIADRGNKRIQMLDLKGNFVDEWTCAGTPWGIRSYMDSVFQVDGDASTFIVLDGSQITSRSLGSCSVVATVQIDPTTCNTPHLAGFDLDTGDVYVACVKEPGSDVIRVTCK